MSGYENPPPARRANGLASAATAMVATEGQASDVYFSPSKEAHSAYTDEEHSNSGSIQSFESRGERERKRAISYPVFSVFQFNVAEIQFLERLGAGAFGEVWKARYRGEIFAVKCLKDAAHMDMLSAFKITSSELACALPHKNIVKYYAFTTKNYQDFYLVMEYMSRGALSKLLKTDPIIRGDLRLRIKMAKDIARGMNALHTACPPILHRDLRSANILVDEDYVAHVADFGLSEQLKSQRLRAKGRCGYVRCVAPEVFLKKEYKLSSDCYSYGMLLYELLTCQSAFEGVSFQDIKRLIKANHRPPLALLEALHVPPTLIQLVNDCWHEIPEKRPTFLEILDVFDLIDSQFIDIFEACERNKVQLVLDMMGETYDRPDLDSVLSSPIETAPKEFIDVLDETGKAPLFHAIMHGNTKLVEYLLTKGADLAQADYFGKIPLHYAALNSRTSIIETLLYFGADPDVSDATGTVPLHYAALLGDAASVKCLLERGASIYKTDKNGRTALHYACRQAHYDVALELLNWEHKLRVARGEPPQQSSKLARDVDKERRTSLHYCASGGAAKHFVEMLIARGADVSAVDRRGQTALHYASFFGHEDVVTCLIEHKQCDITASDEKGLTGLHLACFIGSLSIVRLLARLPGTINALDADGNTPLSIAIIHKHSEVTGELLRSGANPNIPDLRGFAPLHLAALDNSTDLIELLLANRADSFAREKSQKTALHLAALEGRVEACALLLSKGVPCDIVDGEGNAPVHCAAYGGRLPALKFLHSKGAKLFEWANNNNTALHFASMAGSLECVEYLVENGAYVNSLNDYKQTPLHAAALGGFAPVIRYLLYRCALPRLADSFYNTPLSYAVQNRHQDCIVLLEQASKAK